MFDLSFLDEEELIQLASSCFSLLFSLSYIFSLIKFFRHKFTYDSFPIISLFFCFLNNLIWAQYSDIIYHESMKLLFQCSSVISCGVIIIYSLFELKSDIIDSILNILILITSAWAVKKLLVDILKEEEKFKTTCCYSIIILYLSCLEWTFRSHSEKNTNILNLISAITLLCFASCWVYLGFKYEDKYFLFSNLFGVFACLIYILVWNKLKKKYGYVVPVKVKAKKEEKKDNKDNKEIKEENKENQKEKETDEITTKENKDKKE